MRVGRSWMLLVGLLAMSAFTGCTRSLEMTYSPALYRLPQAEKWNGIVLGVAILTLFGVFEKRRNEVLHLVEELRRWD